MRRLRKIGFSRDNNFVVSRADGECLYFDIENRIIARRDLMISSVATLRGVCVVVSLNVWQHERAWRANFAC